MLLRPLALAAALAVAQPALAQDLTPDEVKRLALEAILENPEIVMEAVEILREREEAAQAEATRSAISDLTSELTEDPNAPVLGNPDGDVTVVEFFDYNCPYCKRAATDVKGLLAADGNVRLVQREWPILGEGTRRRCCASPSRSGSTSNGSRPTWRRPRWTSTSRSRRAWPRRLASPGRPRS